MGKIRDTLLKYSCTATEKPTLNIRVHQMPRCHQNVLSLVLFRSFDGTMTLYEIQETSDAIWGVLISFQHTSPTDISQDIDKVSRKALLWLYKLASKSKVTCHARNTLTKYGGSPLSFGPPPLALRGSSTPKERSKIQNCRTELIAGPHWMANWPPSTLKWPSSHAALAIQLKTRQQMFLRDNMLYQAF